jgi:phosphoribosylformylglycinamidine cyclo-ligase
MLRFSSQKSLQEHEDGHTYLSSGVDSAAGEAALAGFEPLIEQTKRTGCRNVAVPDLGLARGSFCDMKELAYKDPIMVSGTSNVGTKLKVASRVGRLDTVGIDLVALCVNDVVAQGAEPLVFHNHFATAKLDVQ